MPLLSSSSRLRSSPRPLLAPVLALLLSFAAFALTTLSFVPASYAQISIPQKASLPRTDREGKNIAKRGLQYTPEGISYQDCIDDIRLRVAMVLPQPQVNASLQAWGALGGVDCSQQDRRESSNATCWRVTGDIPLAQNVEILIPVRKIFGGRANEGGGVADGKDGPEICGTVDRATYALQFLYFAPNQLATPAFKEELSVLVDTIGPAAPTGLSIKPGNTRLSISFNALGEGGVVELSTIRAYCDENPGQAPVGDDAGPAPTDAADAADAEPSPECDAGDADACDAGEGEVQDQDQDEGPTPIPTCGSGAFTSESGDPILPDEEFNARYSCGVLPVATTGNVIVARAVGGRPLENGKTYAVAIAAVDTFLNVGPLSSVVCDFPERTTDFWEDYVDAGGRAGGCAVDASGVPVGSFGVMAVAALLAMSTARRFVVRRKRTSRAPSSAARSCPEDDR